MVSQALLLLLSTATALASELSFPPPATFASNGYANWGAGTWPPASVGVPLVPQTTDPEILSLISQIDPARIEHTITTLVNFGTRHTASTTTSPTRGIGAARNWLLKQMQEYAKPANGLIKVSMPCYFQPAEPEEGLPIGVDVCNVQAEIKGAIDPNRTIVYTGHYDSRRINGSDYENDAPGADDNASAVSIALEMVRILGLSMAKNKPASSIIIAAVAGEEQGLYGSTFLANTLKNASVNVEASFNNDIVGTGSNAPFNKLNQHTVRIYSGGTDILDLPEATIDEIISTGYQDDTPSRNMARFIQEVNAGAAHTTDMEVAILYKTDRFDRGGDHEPFLEVGFPAVRFTESNENFFHQHQDPREEDGVVYGDNIEFVDFDYTARVGKVNMLSMLSMANAPDLPKNFTYVPLYGFLASDEQAPVASLDNVVKLNWTTEPRDPLLDHFEVVWRSMSSQQVSFALK
ncbi:Zn-dependent exopeptidase [Penicillium lagena]|uniref:Zn-dependent exopeptidase n=1 Tax=Penicillium lagena TaxID=94218 RepID=UPI0025402019|nr:Zn-dependent exopeptidase [Penicillium lagena]KAJ5625065.1 Zn-dependent exopeptidase [Penicillium lagena]